MTWAWSVALPPTSKLVLMALADIADDQGVCWPSQPTLAAKCSLTDRTVRRVLALLQANKLVLIEPRFKTTGSRTSNRYRLVIDTPPEALPPHQRQLARFALATGLRQANVLGMRWTDVDLKRRTAWVHADEAKGGTAIGVPLNDEAIAVLREEIGKHGERVFTYKRRPVASVNTKAWRNALRRAASSTSAGTICGTFGRRGTSWRAQRLGNCKSLARGNPRRWSNAMPTSHRSKCAKRPTGLLRFGIQQPNRLRLKHRNLLIDW